MKLVMEKLCALRELDGLMDRIPRGLAAQRSRLLKNRAEGAQR